jgi:hypothetical protein
MNDRLPPRGNYRDGQDFQTQRAKNRMKGVESANYADGCCGGPRPADVWKGQTKTLEGTVKSAKVTQQPSNQDRYGGQREAIRRIRPFGKPVG